MLSRIVRTGCLVLAAVSALVAQESRGGISGKVTDPGGALVVGATVVVTNIETNVVNRLTTNHTGYYEVNLLIPGHYSVRVEAAGFKRELRSGLELNVGGRL